MMNLGFAAYAHRLFREGGTGINKRSQEFFLALFLLLACVSIHFQESFNRRGFSVPLARIAVVQPYVPQDVKWDPARAPAILEILRKTTLEAAALRPDLIIWPESVMPLTVRGDEVAETFVETLVKRTNVPLLLGSNAVEHMGTLTETWFNAAVLVSPGDGVAERYYAKRELVPFGEYVPFRPLLGWLNKIVPIGEGDFGRGESSSPLIVPLSGQVTVVGPLICYEDIFPQLARHSAMAGASVLTVLTNNGWFGEGGAAYQHAAHSVLRAVETRRPLIRAGNGGWSGWIDEFGIVRATMTNESGSIYFRGARAMDVTRDARWSERSSFYTEYGDWFVFVSAGLLMFGIALLKMAELPVRPAEPAVPRGPER
jgi:apolipoprotein N-acyltransferase